MIFALSVIFILGYAAIALEHPLKINKTASSLLLGTLCWTVWICSDTAQAIHINHTLSEQLAEVAQILFFLMGAMTIVELVDAHQGFQVITNRITTNSVTKLAWLIGFVTFFLSAILDNLTTTIVMISLVKKLLSDREQRLLFAGLIVIAANAGGAWSPIGDVTTTMLWIGGQISALSIMKEMLMPSLACLLAPLFFISWQLKNAQAIKILAEGELQQAMQQEKIKGSRRMFCLGVGGLIFVPIFKILTHLPPYIGMLFVLSIVWVASELLHVDKTEEEKKPYTAVHALTRIDVPSVLFFLGILLAIGALQGTGILTSVANYLASTIGNEDIIAIVIGLLSAIVDNVPLVAAIQKMYPLASETVNQAAFLFSKENLDVIHHGSFIFEGMRYHLADARIWSLIAYTAGTGGSCLIIGSAAGVAAMGLEKIDFIWYLKRVSLLALSGYIAGLLVFFLFHGVTW